MDVTHGSLCERRDHQEGPGDVDTHPKEIDGTAQILGDNSDIELEVREPDCRLRSEKARGRRLGEYRGEGQRP
jgi:hypothetical protein